jgi:hypothetical protein
MAERRWRVRLGAAAELDFANILKWTTENFGARIGRAVQLGGIRSPVQIKRDRWSGSVALPRPGTDRRAGMSNSTVVGMECAPASNPWESLE